MNKNILLGVKTISATSKIVSDVCEEYEGLDEDKRPEKWKLLPFVLETLANGGKKAVVYKSTNSKDVFEYFAGMVGMNFEDPKKRINSVVGLCISAIGIIGGFTYAGIANAKIDIKES